SLRRMAAHPFKVRLVVVGVDHDVDSVVAPVGDEVVKDDAGLVAHEVVLGPPWANAGKIVGQKTLKELEAAVAVQPESTHVRDIEKAGGPAHREVLIANRRVLLRKLPSPEVDHASA